MNFEDGSDDFVEHNAKRAQRRLKVLQRQSTPSHKAATTIQKKRQTPAPAPASVKRSLPTPRSFVAASSTPKAPSKPLQHVSAPSSVSISTATSVGDKQQTQSTRQLQQAAEYAKGEATAPSVAESHVLASGQQQPEADSSHGTPPAVAEQDWRHSADVVPEVDPCAVADTPVPKGGDAAGAAAVCEAPTVATCPVCGLVLADLSSTEAGQAAHVNACLDATAAAPQAGLPGEAVLEAAAVSDPACNRQQEPLQQQQQDELAAAADADAEENITTW
jgi:hypothetical protein